MSSILKALKKLEEERVTRRGEKINIAGGLLRSEPQARSIPRWLFPSAMIAVAALAVLITFALMGGFSSRPTMSLPAPAASASITLPERAIPVPPPTVQATDMPPHATVLPPKSPRVAPAAASTASRVKPQQAAVSPANTRQDKAPVTGTPVQTGQPAAASPPPPQPVSSHPSLRVSGIAWQKDSASRIAMINGQAVSKGVKVAGATIEEILPDRVRFSIAGETFDVLLGKSSSETK